MGPVGAGRGDGEQVDSRTIITTAANEVIAAFHERMPVILDAEDYGVWLDPAVHDTEPLLPLLKSYPRRKDGGVRRHQRS